MMSQDPSQPPLDLAAEEADKLLTAANVARMRHDLQSAEEKVRQALQIKPDLAAGHAFLAEILLARGDGEGALEAYTRAQQLSPGSTKYEDGYAKATLAVAEAERRKALALNAATGARPPMPPRNPTLAVLASLVIPGAGQLYNGQVAKAVIFLALVVGLFLLGTVLSGAQVVKWFSAQFVPQLEGAYDVEHAGAGGVNLDYRGAVSRIGVVCYVIFTILYIWNFVDAGLTANRLNREDTGKSGWEV
jgi:tetratricopeptide (TPR) repeat protein